MKPTLKNIVEMLVKIEDDYKDVTLTTAGNMVRIAQGEPGNYIIFQNRQHGGPAIWRGDDVGTFAKKILSGETTGVNRQYLYAYVASGQEIVLALPRKEKTGYIRWYRQDDDYEDSPWREFET